MKKLHLLLIAAGLSLCGCSSNNNNNSCNSGVTSVALTRENISTYLSIEKTDGYVSNLTNHYIRFKGVLTFAIYDNVQILLNMNMVTTSTDRPNHIDKERILVLNAAGEGTSTLYYANGQIDNVVDTGIGNGHLQYYKCTWSILSITGNVKYRL